MSKHVNILYKCPCDGCGKKLAGAWSLKMHLKRMHNDAKLVMLDGYDFNSKRNQAGTIEVKHRRKRRSSHPETSQVKVPDIGSRMDNLNRTIEAAPPVQVSFCPCCGFSLAMLEDAMKVVAMLKGSAAPV